MRLVFGVVLVTGCGFGGASGQPQLDSPPAIDAPEVDAPPPPTSPRKLTFANPATVALTDFPVLVALTPTEVDYAKVADPTHDLKFIDGSSTLDFEVDTWNPGGESIVWVRVPQIDVGSSDSILMHFGPSIGTADPAGVWDPHYVLVNHLAGTLQNSAIAGTTYDAVASGSAVGTTGRMGNGVGFAGAGRVDFANAETLFSDWGQFTLEMWLRPNYTTLAEIVGEPMVAEKGVSLTLGRLYTSGVKLKFQIDFHYKADSVTQPTSIETQAWNYLVYTFDGTTQRLYLNDSGTPSVAPIGATTLQTSTMPFFLGGAAPFNGAIDELRISTTGHDANWILAQYRSMTRQFVSFSDP